MAYQPMEPGLMKLSLIGDYSNESQVSFKVRVTRENFRTPPKHPVSSGVIKMGDAFIVPVDVPEGVSVATFDLEWHRKWDKFPTSDIDMYFFDPQGDFVFQFDGATGNAPERSVIVDPVPGTWYVLIESYEMYKPDLYELFLTLE
jgi:hypothetical protein